MFRFVCFLVLALNFSLGISSSITDDLLSVEDYKNKAKEFLNVYKQNNYYHGAFEDITLGLNTKAFAEIRIKPKYLIDVSHINMSTTVLGTPADWPVGVAPMARHRDAHPDGEIATARGAGKSGSIFILSSLAQTLLEDVAQGAPDTEKWFQMYLNKNQTINSMFIDRAERAGYKAIVLTLDDPTDSVVRNLNYQKFRKLYSTDFPNYSSMGLSLNQHTFGPSTNVEDLRQFVQNTKLPVIVKGVLTGSGAALAKTAGVKGVIVSNHGGRNLDSAPASIEALPEVVDAVGGQMTVMLDSGIRGGPEVFKALALGAKQVFVGSPVIWGLAIDGEDGVHSLLEMIKNEFEVVMTLAGSSNLTEIKRGQVVHESYYDFLLMHHNHSKKKN
ncbi:HAO1.2 family protein [Megaselia abdita]